jgi:hypothetical protein
LRHAIPSASRTTRAEKKPEDAHIPARAPACRAGVRPVRDLCVSLMSNRGHAGTPPP